METLELNLRAKKEKPAPTTNSSYTNYYGFMDKTGKVHTFTSLAEAQHAWENLKTFNLV
jgi:hypothetical protein